MRRDGADASEQRPGSPGLKRQRPSKCFDATGVLDQATVADRRSGALRRGLHERDAAGEAADSDAAGPDAGACGRVVLAKVVPEFHP